MKPTPAPWLAPLLSGGPVAVLGAGRSGKAACDLLRASGAEPVLYDERPGSGSTFGPSEATRHRLVVFSPGFASDHAWLRFASQAGAHLLTELDFASGFWTGPIWSITGTNGKSTLTELLTAALRKAGRSAVATGNIGHPFSAIILENHAAGTVAVCEVSSFQAEMLSRFRSNATLWTNLAEDHLERHPGMVAYFHAKHRLLQLTDKGRCWTGPSVVPFAREAGVPLESLGQVVDTSRPPEDPAVCETVFGRAPQLENYHVARALWTGLGFPAEIFDATAAEFPLARHRIAHCGTIRGVSFHNDSKGTNFHAVLGALATFSRPPHWIGGGKNKGGSLRNFARELAPRIASASLIGETGGPLADELRHAAPTLPVSVHNTLREATHSAYAHSQNGDAVLLSPGFSSFDMFRSYEDRGDQFEALVAELAAAHATHQVA